MIRGIIFAAAWLCLAGGLLNAQITTGTIRGYIKDPTGAAINGAQVTATMVEQQTSRTTTSDSEGFYSFLAMPPGTYQLTFDANGFQKQVRTGVELTVNQNVRVDAELAVGSVETQVTVNASATRATGSLS